MMRKLNCLLFAVLSTAFSVTSELAVANAPGGVTGAGRDVTVTDNGDDTVTMALTL